MSGQPDNQVEELKKLFAKPKVETIGRRSVQLRPFEFELLPDVLEAAAPILPELADPEVSRIQLFKRHRDRVFALVALLSGCEEQWVRKIPSYEGLKLFTGCLEVNADFFSQGLPHLLKLMNLARPATAKSSSSVQAQSSAGQPAGDESGTQASPASDTGSASPSS